MKYKSKDRDLGFNRLSKEWWFYTVPLCVRSKYEKSYKDIPDEKFEEVVEYIEELKKNPS